MNGEHLGAYRADIVRYAKEYYGSAEEHLWARSPSDAIIRRPDNGKWYAVFMTVSRARLGLQGEGTVDIFNVKCDELLIGSLLERDCILPAYHMNKRKWISILLDGSADIDLALGCLRMSYDLTATSGKTRGKSR